MHSTEQHKIADFIKLWASDETRLVDLLTYSIGRVCMNMTLRGEDWETELGTIDAGHITDWLKAAIINNDPWLRIVDDQGRPKKLMKFGNLQDIMHEADKAMFKGIQRNGLDNLVDGDEELHMILEDGYRLVRLLTPTALDREGKLMQHCIGNGAYDKTVELELYRYLSLRDKNNKPHATMEIRDASLHQFQGKQNKPPKFIYTQKLAPYFKKNKLNFRIPFSNLGCYISKDGEVYDFHNLPNGIVIDGELNLRYARIKSLPTDMTIYGSCHLDNTQITSLPRNMNVRGDLTLTNLSIRELPATLVVSGSIRCSGSKVKSIPENFYVGNSLQLDRTEINSIPKGLIIGGNLNLEGTSITTLPPCLQVGCNIDLRDSNIESLPDNMHVTGYLNLNRTELRKLPQGLRVDGDLFIQNLEITELPDDIIVGGNIYLYGTPISSLPENLPSTTPIDTGLSLMSAGDYRKVLEERNKPSAFRP